MEISLLIAIFYWIGYGIVFLTLLVFSGWALANSEKLEREHPDGDINILNLLLALLLFPWFSWLLILILVIALVFEKYKER